MGVVVRPENPPRASLTGRVTLLAHALLLGVYAILILFELLMSGRVAAFGNRLKISVGVVILFLFAIVYAREWKDRGRLKLLLVLAWLFGLIAQFVLAFSIWPRGAFLTSTDSIVLRLIGSTLGVMCVATCYSIAIYRVHVMPGWRWLRGVTVVSVVGTAATGWLYFVSAEEKTYLPWFAIASLLHGMVVLMMVLVRQVEKDRARQGFEAEGATMRFECPRCRNDCQSGIYDEEMQCQACGLLVRIEVVQPGCPKCGYLLYGLGYDTCPECGAATYSEVSASD